ncbi:MAG: FxSxx-COOH system tetratricopeptide repeat protein [Pseudonocardiaceae bacterium]
MRDFLSVASPAAFRLATLLAALPVSLPLARLVQAELVPESGPDHLAEVFNSGLLKPSGITGSGHAPDSTTFDFPDPVRELLLSGARRSETARVVHLVAEHSNDSTAHRVAAALRAPENTPLPDTASSVATERIVLRALSGPYLDRAAQLHSAEQGEQLMRGTGSSAEGIKSDTLPKVTQHTPVANPPTRSRFPVPGPPTLDPTSSDESASGDVDDARYSGSHTTTGTTRETKTQGPTPIWGNVPPRNPNFTGREELLSLLSEHLTAGSTTAVLPAALYGMGGIGKTQMAVEYIYQHMQDYDIIWWIAATEPAQIRAGLTELAQRLGLPGSAEANTAVPSVREALRIGEPYRNWLLVFDSAESPKVVRPFFPASEFGTILITSRNPDWAAIANPLEVAVFKREESKKLLTRRGPAIDDKEADQLAEKLGDLPLAIAQAATWRAETGMPVHEYLRLFDEKVAEILDTSAPMDYETSVAAAWRVSLDELKTRNPAAHQLLQVCAFFAPDPISRDLFTRVRGDSISPELDAALQDPMRLSKTIRDIHRYGLAKIDHRNNTLQLHRLVQLVLSNRMTPQEQQKMLHGAHVLLANLDPNDPVPAKQWPQYLNMLPHAYAAHVIECDDSWVRQLVINLMIFLYHWGDHEEACRLAQQAVDAWTDKLGEANPQTLKVAERLGFYLWTLGRFAEAARINDETLKRHRETSGENSEETLVAEIAVATDLKGSGNFLAALDLNTQIYQKARALFGDDDPTTLLTAHDTVVSLGLAGEYRKGRELAEDTYRRRVEVIGYDNPGTMSTLNALILARREAGDYTWARVEQEKVAQRSGELFGVDRAATLRRRHHLSVARRKDGDHPGALKLSTEVLEPFQLRYGEDHPNVMACALAKSIDLRHANELQEARALGEETFERYRRKLGENHPHTLSALLDLALTLRLLGEVTGARQLDERVLEQFRTVLGADHPYSIVSAINLASDLAAMGEAEEALAAGTEALERAQRVLGPDHPTTLAATMNLVLDLRSLDRAEEAETKYVEVVTRYHRVLGDKHPATRNAAEGIRADCDIDPLPL